MKTSLRLALFIIGLGTIWLSPARAQTVSATVVTTCGTLPTPYVAGQAFPVTMDVTGTLCSGAGGGGGGGAVTIANGADVALGNTADAAWSGTGSGTGIALLKNIALGVAGPIPTGGNVIGGLLANQSVNTAQVNGVTTLTGAGATGTGAQRFVAAQDTSTIAGSAPGTAGSASSNVLTVQGIASMTKLLVTPDSVALPANQSVNVAQVNGVTTLTGAGATGTGAIRVVAAQDTSTLAGSAPGTAGTPSTNVLTVQGAASMTKLLVTPDSVALPANQSVNLSQVNGVTVLTGAGAVGTGSARIAVGTDSSTIAGSAPGTVLLANTTTPYPSTAVPITASATGTTAATTATLTNVTAHTTYICGFSVRANATAAATGNATVTGTISGTLNFTQWTAPLASGLGINEQVFVPCIPASAVSTSIAVVSAAPGTGGVVSVTAWGYSI